MEEAEFAAGVDGAGKERQQQWIAMNGEGGKAAATAATATVATAVVATVVRAMAGTAAAAKAKRPGGSTSSLSCFVFFVGSGFRFISVTVEFELSPFCGASVSSGGPSTRLP